MEKGCFMLFKVKQRKLNSDKIHGLKREYACNEVLSRNTDTTDSSTVSVFIGIVHQHLCKKTPDPVKPIRWLGGGVSTD